MTYLKSNTSKKGNLTQVQLIQSINQKKILSVR